ncbi:MAG: hypothetical protein DRN19_02835 [Thermoplasmata archaeon]|nr:MAG: hypothetical protein DRN19_02835 [Thermoplasmata archaeon]
MIRLLGLSATIDILKLLLENERMYGEQLKREIGKKGSVENRLRELELLGIIASEVEDKFQGKKWYWLTEKGRKVAEKVKEIEEILGEK